MRSLERRSKTEGKLETNPILERMPQEYRQIATATTFSELEAICNLLGRIESADRYSSSGYSRWFGDTIKQVYVDRDASPAEIRKLAVEPLKIFDDAVTKGNELFELYKAEVIAESEKCKEKLGVKKDRKLSPKDSRHTIQANIATYMIGFSGFMDFSPASNLTEEEREAHDHFVPHYLKLGKIGKVLESAAWYADMMRFAEKNGRLTY